MRPTAHRPARGRPPSSSPGGPNAERYGVVAWLTISRASSTRDVTSTFRKMSVDQMQVLILRNQTEKLY